MTVRRILLSTIAVVLFSCPAFAQSSAPANKNAALRYWSAFSVMQDSAITARQGSEIMLIVDGAVPYDDSKFKDLVERNKLALEIMARATRLPDCDWGLDYSFGSNEPVEYARKAMVLGRLNVLYAYHLMTTGNTDAAVNALAAGLRFSHGVDNGGPLLAALISDQLISGHLHAIVFAERNARLSGGQRLQLRKAIADLGPEGVDWRSAIDQEFQVMRTHLSSTPGASAALTRIDSAWVKALRDPSALSALEEAIRAAPPAVAQLIPNARRILEAKQKLSTLLAQTRSSLQ